MTVPIWPSFNMNKSYGEQLWWQVPAIIDPSVHWDKPLNSWFVLDTWIVKTGVQHYYGKGQHIAGVWNQRTISLILGYISKQEYIFTLTQILFDNAFYNVEEDNCKGLFLNKNTAGVNLIKVVSQSKQTNLEFLWIFQSEDFVWSTYVKFTKWAKLGF